MDSEHTANVSFQTLLKVFRKFLIVILFNKPITLGEALFVINRKVIIEIVDI